MESTSASDPTGDRPLIIQVIRRVCPLEADLLGPKLVEGIVTGKSFMSADGGRHISLESAIQVVNCVVAVVGCIKGFWPRRNVDAAVPPRADEVAAEVQRRALEDEQLARRLADDPAFVERVLAAVVKAEAERVRRT